jgi:Phage tail protein.
MLTMVEARTPQGTLLGISLEDVTDGIIVADIEGLDPVKATIVSSSFARLDGVQYQSSRREARNIKLKLGLEPDYINNTVSDIRQRLYQFFMPKREVNLRFITSTGLSVDISGRVESFESPLFTKEPQVDISVVCFDPDLVDPTLVEVSGLTTADTTESLVTYEGSVETGITFVLNVDRVISEFTFYHRPPDNTLRSLEFATPLEAGDVLTISTIAGSKGATLKRAGVDSSVLYGISPQSNWIELMPGDNNIRVYAEGLGIPYDIEYVNKYGGL